MSNYHSEARLWAALTRGFESEGIRPVKIMSQYDAVKNVVDIRVDHVSTGTTITHSVWLEDIDLPLDKLVARVIDPIVTKMLEELTK